VTTAPSTVTMSKSFSGIQLAQRGKKFAIQLTKCSEISAERQMSVVLGHLMATLISL